MDELRGLVKMFDLCLNTSDRVFLALLLTKTDKRNVDIDREILIAGIEELMSS